MGGASRSAAPPNGLEDYIDKMKKQNVSDTVIRRLPRYYRYLDDLHVKGIVRISSSTLGEKMGITASQIRQDLSCGHILGVDNQHRLIIVGVGNLGHALMQNFRFRDAGFLLEAAFDIDPRLIGTEVAGVPILDFADLEEFIPGHRPDVAVLTVSQSVAQSTADHLIQLGIRGFWNFTNVELSTDVENVRFEDVHFADSLLTLSYRITER